MINILKQSSDPTERQIMFLAGNPDAYDKEVEHRRTWEVFGPYLPQPQSVKRHFEPGDVVILKSGGPSMTISTWEPVEGSGKLWMCEWFDDAKHLHAQKFSDYMLEHPVVITWLR